MADRDEENRLVSEFSDVTGTDTERARFFLESSGWQLHLALSSFYEDGGDDPPSPPSPSEPQHIVCCYDNWCRSVLVGPELRLVQTITSLVASKGSSARIATMSTYRAGQEHDSEEEEGQAFYAGGSETSGQQILGPPKSKKKETPSNMTQDIFDEARRHGAEEIVDEPGPNSKPPSWFTGTGYRLGDTEGGISQPVAGSIQPQRQPQEVSIKFWSNGFSVDDGELRSFDDPKNKEFIDAVKRGEIPRELYRLSHGGEVHVNLEDHRHEEYTPPKKKLIVAFQGTGQKLGSPTPDIKCNEEKVKTAVTSIAGPSGASMPSPVDQSKPMTSIQIRLGDGTRLVSKFNHTNTVGDIKAFIVASRPQMADRPFVLMTTFPSKELTDDGQTIQDANLLNAVIVQRFK